MTACPAEKSGKKEFDFEYGEDFARHIEAFDPTFCKVLVRYNPGADGALNHRQAARLQRLSDYLAAAKRSHFMFEDTRDLNKAGSEPDVWTTDGTDLREDCEAVVAAARAGGRDHVGCIVL